MDISYDEKLEKLGILDNKDIFPPKAIDILYKKYLEEKKPEVVLNLLNIILCQIGYQKVKKLEDFVVVVSDFKKLDSQKFLENNMDIIKKELFLDPKKDLKFNL